MSQAVAEATGDDHNDSSYPQFDDASVSSQRPIVNHVLVSWVLFLQSHSNKSILKYWFWISMYCRLCETAETLSSYISVFEYNIYNIFNENYKAAKLALCEIQDETSLMIQICVSSSSYTELWPGVASHWLKVQQHNNRFTALCPGLPGWASTRKKTLAHPPTILIIIQSLSASSIYHDP